MMVRVMPMLSVLPVMPWLMLPLVMPMVRVLPVMFPLTAPLVMMMVAVLQVMVLGGGRCLGHCSPVLAVWPAYPVDASGDADGEGAVGDVLGAGVAGDAYSEAGAGDGVVDADDEDAALGDADGEGAVGDAPGVVVAGDADGEGAAGDAPHVGTACDPDGECATGDAMVDGAAGYTLMVRVLHGLLQLTVRLVLTTVRVLQVIFLVVGLRMGDLRQFWELALATPGRGPAGCCWSVGSLVLAVLVASGVRAAPRLAEGAFGDADGERGAGDGVVHADGVAGVVPGDAESEGAVIGDAAGSWRCRWGR